MSRRSVKRSLALMLVSFVTVNTVNLPVNFAGRSVSLAFAGEESSSDTAQTTPETRSRVREAYGKLPLSFEVNQGQTASQVKFLSRGNRYQLFLTSNEATLVLNKAAAEQRSDVLKIKLMDANLEPQVTGEGELTGKSNYLVGNDSRQWRTNIANYTKVKYDDVYPGIDMVYYGNGHQLEYDFIVAAGGDPSMIKLSVEGASKMRLDERGDLLLSIGGSEIRQHKPFIYQEVNGVKKEVAGQYVLCGKQQVAFKVAEYDKSIALVIDPVLSYSTYLGGSGADVARGIAVDRFGKAYVTGQTTSLNFPTRAGAFQTTFAGSLDVFVTKLNETGSALVYSTYLGGLGFDAGQSIDVDADGNAYVAGNTTSSDFPSTAGAFQPVFGGGGQDAFVTKLNATGSALVYSTFLGGLDVDGSLGISVGRLGNVYVTGSTESNNFPTTAGAVQPIFGGIQDAFVTKFNETGSALVYSTFLGGSGADTGVSITRRFGIAYVTGSTNSSNFPTTAGAVQPTFGGLQDAFVTKLNETGTTFAYSTYLGGTGGDAGQGIAVGRFGNVYVTGTTSSSTFPTTAGAFQTTRGGLSDAFVTKLNETGSALVYSTFLGGSGADSGQGIVARFGEVYLTGSTLSSNFPVTAGAIQATISGGQDAFVTKLNETGSALVFSTYLGGTDADAGHSIDVISGNAYVAGNTSSLNFPTTTRAFQKTNAGGSEAFVTKIEIGR
jgi:beta-propeller repeat-containing protein